MKTYWMRFGSGDPRTLTGLSPTFVVFAGTGGAVTPPAISEVTSSGLYWFNWGTTTPIAFIADAATTSPGPSGRYVVGTLDPVDRVDESLGGIGTTASSFGTASVDPVDLYGYLKRIQENLEGNQTFIKASGALTISTRGSSTTLANKTISNSISTVIKT